MSVLGEAGRTRLSIPAIGRPERPVDPFLEAVREAAGADFTVFGEIGRAADGSISYLARDAQRDCLVALKLARRPAAPDEFELEVVQELRDDLPAFDRFCAKCGSALRAWGRFCPHCGAEVFGDVGPWSPEELRQAVSDFAGDRYDILGEMRSQGGRIYFALEKSSGKIEALRLEKKGADEFALGLTGVLKPIVQGIPSAPARAHVPSPPPAAPRLAASGDRGEPARQPGLTAPPAPLHPAAPARGPAPVRPARPRMVDEWVRLGRELWGQILERPVAIVALVVAGMVLLVVVLALLT
jgi:hypothetical protein